MSAALDDQTLSKLTLSTWAATVWEKELRGSPLQKHEAALAWCMRLHDELRNFWNSLNHPRSTDAPRTTILVHIYNDAAVKFQLDTSNPPEILELFHTMKRNGFSDVDSLHALAFVMQEQTWKAKNTGLDFNMAQYIERATAHVDNVLEHPEIVHSLRCP